MIIPMKSVTLLALTAEKQAALLALRELGAMQLDAAQTTSTGTAFIKDELNSAERALTVLQNLSDQNDKINNSKGYNKKNGLEIVKRVSALLEKKSALDSSFSDAKKRLARLADWGNFSLEKIKILKRQGIEVLLCSGTRQDYQRALEKAGVAVQLLGSDDKEPLRFAVVFDTRTPVDCDDCPIVKMDEDDYPEILNQRCSDIEKQLNSVDKELFDLASCKDIVEQYVNDLRSKYEFAQAIDALSEHDDVVTLHGYVPVPKINVLRETARKEGWGLLILDPDEDENVPVLLEENSIVKIVKPLFDFLGITPGYRELDVSGSIFFFFTIFYAMIVGDAGYGLLFLITTLICLRKFRKVAAAKIPLRFAMILSVATIAWGAVSGSWFGLATIPGTDKPFPAIKYFANPETKDANVQCFCFILAVIQLSLGHFWQALKERNFRNIFGNIGWTLIIWGNFLLTLKVIVFPGEFPTAMFWLYGIGGFLVILFGVNWKSVSDAFQFPFSIINSFTDVLSYIRLFAVGMAGGCIAASFNDMSYNVASSSLWAIPVGVAIVLVGHALNISLCFLSVLVHGVRLNTLEFSGHVGVSWSGEEYHPFSNKSKQQKGNKK